MRKSFWILGAALLPVLVGCVCGTPSDPPRFQRLVVWHSPTDEKSAALAAECGVTDAVGASPKQVELGRTYGYRVYGLIVPYLPLWKKHHGGSAEHAPLQQLSEEEQALFLRYTDRISGAENRKKHQTRFGGEVEDGSRMDLITTQLLCFSHPETAALIRKEIDLLCGQKGLSGIAFDFVGYQNLHDCGCPLCRKRCAEYLKKNPGKKPSDFYRSVLVEFNNGMIAHIKRKRPDYQTLTHLYPVFRPSPLYGRDLKFDLCGETVAWYFLWPDSKIRAAAKAVSSYPAGVPFLGYYQSELLPEFPHKSGERVAKELDLILASGGRTVMVCSFQHVLREPEVFRAFKERCAPRETYKK